MRLADKIWPGYCEQLESCKEQHKRMQTDQTTRYARGLTADARR